MRFSEHRVTPRKVLWGIKSPLLCPLSYGRIRLMYAGFSPSESSRKPRWQLCGRNGSRSCVYLGCMPAYGRYYSVRVPGFACTAAGRGGGFRFRASGLPATQRDAVCLTTVSGARRLRLARRAVRTRLVAGVPSGGSKCRDPRAASGHRTGRTLPSALSGILSRPLDSPVLTPAAIRRTFSGASAVRVGAISRCASVAAVPALDAVLRDEEPGLPLAPLCSGQSP